MPRTQSKAGPEETSTGTTQRESIVLNIESESVETDTVITNDTSIGTSDVNNIVLELKKFMMELKEDIMTKLTENQREMKEMKADLKSMTDTVNDVEEDTSSHAARQDEIEQKV